jgi:hypothetical protein
VSGTDGAILTFIQIENGILISALDQGLAPLLIFYRAKYSKVMFEITACKSDYNSQRKSVNSLSHDTDATTSRGQSC